jgi:phosphoribosylamine--glycine ligase
MAEAGVPTGRSTACTTLQAALDAVYDTSLPVVIKADGLAAGKGVVICETREEAEAAVREMLEAHSLGDAGSTVLVEEFLTGREVSAFALSDGRDVLPLASAQDHKRAFDGDEGPNTGGMGAFSPVPFVDADLDERIRTEILEPTVSAMAAEGTPYVGVLYAGLMVTDDGPKVLEFNARFGDPETQVLMPRLGSDLAELALACAEGNLEDYRALVRPQACVTVVLASANYPEPSDTGFEITGLADAVRDDDVLVFHAGTAERNGRVVSAGGRVLAVSGLGGSIAAARERAYEAIGRISFTGMRYRTDIAARAAEEERA